MIRTLLMHKLPCSRPNLCDWLIGEWVTSQVGRVRVDDNGAAHSMHQISAIPDTAASSAVKRSALGKLNIFVCRLLFRKENIVEHVHVFSVAVMC